MRHLLTILAIFSCVMSFAQENICTAMTIHRSDGRQLQYAVAQLDTMYLTSLGDTLAFRTREGNRCHIAIVSIDSMTFDKCDISTIHEAVDMGLSTLWATCNIGSELPEGLGEIYAWGETETKRDYSENKYSYYVNEQYEYIGVNICGTIYDVARQTWGNQWRMPTRSEILELQRRCTWTAETRNGVKGYRATGPNGNHIFLPCAGYQSGTERTGVGTDGFYWSGSLDRTTPSAAYNLNFRGYDAEWTANRSYGFSIRPVR